MNDAIAKRVIEIIAEQAMLETGEITLESTPEELGIDSLGLVESIFAIEESFDVQVPFNANEQGSDQFDISSVGAIVNAVEELVNQKDG